MVGGDVNLRAHDAALLIRLLRITGHLLEASRNTGLIALKRVTAEVRDAPIGVLSCIFHPACCISTRVRHTPLDLHIQYFTSA